MASKLGKHQQDFLIAAARGGYAGTTATSALEIRILESLRSRGLVVLKANTHYTYIATLDGMILEKQLTKGDIYATESAHA